LTPTSSTSFNRRHRTVLYFVLVSALLHLMSVLFVTDWRSKDLEAEAFEARLREVARFEPQRLLAQRPVTTRQTEMEYRPTEARARSMEEVTAQLEAPPPPEAVPEPVVAMRPFDIATRADTFLVEGPEDVQRALAQISQSREEERRESLELLRVSDLAQGHQRAVVLIDPTNRRNITGFVNLTRLRLRGAGGGPLITLDGQPPVGGSGLEALARFMRDHTDLLVQVRQELAMSVSDPSLMEDPVHFLIEGGGQQLIGDWPLLQLTSEERGFLEAYMRQGGLLFIEGRSRFLAQAVDMLHEILGNDAGIRPIPINHPMYHSFFTFSAGFPGENKSQWEYLNLLPPSWNYPSRQYADVATATAAAIAAGPANQDPNQVNEVDTGDPLGLWGVSLGDTLVAVISDLDLHTRWFGFLSDDDDIAIDSAPALHTGINLLIHALTRNGTVAHRRALPAWKNTRPQVSSAVAAIDSSHTDGGQQSDPGLYDVLDASLAIVRAPLGTALGTGGMTIRLDGRQRIDLLRASRNGALLHNLTPGEHWLELDYGGEVEGVDLDLRGGLVTTVTFAVSRLAMLQSVRLEVQPSQVPANTWKTTFSDLDLEEVFLQEDDSFALPP
jgi:hypothetical protein